MSSLKDQVDARKRRLDQLQSLSKNVDINEPHRALDEPSKKKSKATLIGRNFNLTTKETNKQSLSYEENVRTVEVLSAKIEKDALERFKRAADEIITEAAAGGQRVSRSSKNKAIDGTNSMKQILKGKLSELEKRTDDEIKRIVRRQLMEDALKED